MANGRSKIQVGITLPPPWEWGEARRRQEGARKRRELEFKTVELQHQQMQKRLEQADIDLRAAETALAGARFEAKRRPVREAERVWEFEQRMRGMEMGEAEREQRMRERGVGITAAREELAERREERPTRAMLARAGAREAQLRNQKVEEELYQLREESLRERGTRAAAEIENFLMGPVWAMQSARLTPGVPSKEAGRILATFDMTSKEGQRPETATWDPQKRAMVVNYEDGRMVTIPERPILETGRMLNIMKDPRLAAAEPKVLGWGLRELSEIVKANAGLTAAINSYKNKNAPERRDLETLRLYLWTGGPQQKALLDAVEKSQGDVKTLRGRLLSFAGAALRAAPLPGPLGALRRGAGLAQGLRRRLPEAAPAGLPAAAPVAERQGLGPAVQTAAPVTPRAAAAEAPGAVSARLRALVEAYDTAPSPQAKAAVLQSASSQAGRPITEEDIEEFRAYVKTIIGARKERGAAAAQQAIGLAPAGAAR